MKKVIGAAVIVLYLAFIYMGFLFAPNVIVLATNSLVLWGFVFAVIILLIWVLVVVLKWSFGKSEDS